MQNKLARRTFLGVAGAIGGLWPAAAVARDSDGVADQLRLPFTRAIAFRSRHNGVAYRLYVRTPANYDPAGSPLPVLWLLDADYSFAIAANHMEHLADRGHVPQHIIVGVAYENAYPDRELYRLHRTRDYTPVPSAADGLAPGSARVSGGANQFADVVEHEAMPLLTSGYAVDEQSQTLAGHSYGGLFAAWVLQQRPTLFDRYLMVSPSLWFGDGWLLQREEAGQFVAPNRPTRIWAGVGSWEEQPPERPMVAQLQRFVTALRARNDANLSIMDRLFADETHASIFPAAFSTGIRHLFPTLWLAGGDAGPSTVCAAR